MYWYGAKWIIWLQTLGKMSQAWFICWGWKGRRCYSIVSSFAVGARGWSAVCPKVPRSRGCGRDEARLETRSYPRAVPVRARRVFPEGPPLGSSPLPEQRRRDPSSLASPAWWLEGDWLWRLSILYRGDTLHLWTRRENLLWKRIWYQLRFMVLKKQNARRAKLKGKRLICAC